MTWPPSQLPRNFPLTVTPRGYVKRIGGKARWICGRLPPEQALTIYHNKAAAASSGVTATIAPMRRGDFADLRYILNQWLTDRNADCVRGELGVGSFQQYKMSATRIIEVAGLWHTDHITPDHTRSLYDQLSRKYSLDFAKRAIGHLSAACRHAEDHGWCGHVRLGANVVSKLTGREQPQMRWRLYTPDELRTIFDALDRRIRTADGRSAPSLVQLRAMIYLALNGGYGAMELAQLPKAVIDLPGGRIDYRRGKTGEQHIVPLWAETVAAIKPVLKQRPDDELLFRTREGNPWCYRKPVIVDGFVVRSIPNDNVNQRFCELVEPLGLKFDKSGFYKLKHLHSTTADRAGDPHATFALAGHALPGSKSHYVAVGEDRLRKVAEFVRHELLK
jgi:integrase